MMRHIVFLLVLCCFRVEAVQADADSIGPNGINSSGLTLDGDGVAIGQVELGRPGDPTFDTNPGAYHLLVDPTQVFARHPDNVTFTAMRDNPNEIQFHGQEMAGVLISVDPQTKGVSPGAELHSAAIVPTGMSVPGFHEQAAITANHLATQASPQIWAINMSFALNADGMDADGTSVISSYIDWSARVHDILYVVAGYELVQTPQGLIRASGPLPSDNFNGITVVFSEKNGAKFREVDSNNLFDADDFWQGNGDFTHPDIMAPGRGLQFATLNSATVGPDPFRNGTSPAAPHVTGTAALLHQHAVNKGWGTTARRHEVMKAVIMNSADKIEEGSITEHNGLAIPAGGLLGMERTAIDTNGDDWFDSEADDDTADFDAPRNGGFIPLDDQMGVGHLNAKRAFQQYDAGEFASSNSVDVPVIGWDYGFTSGEDDINRYRFDETLKGGSFVSVTLAWDRVVNLSPGDGPTYEVGDTFVDYKETDAPGDLPSDSQINDLDIYFQERGAPTIFSALASSSSRQGNLEHLFFQVPADGEYEFWVVQHDDDIDGIQNYGVAWWAMSAMEPELGSDFNNDGMIDGADLAEWKTNFGTGPGADADGDGDSDGVDFLAWQRNLGATSVAPNAAAVPEPAAWMLCVVGLPFWIGRRSDYNGQNRRLSVS